MKNKNLTFCLIIPRYKKMFQTFYTMGIINGLREGALRLNIDLLIHIGRHGSGSEGAVNRIFNPKIVSGLLFADLMNNEKLVKKAEKKKIPFIILNYFNRTSKYNCVGIDNEVAAFDVTNYLIKLGHRRIATITGKLYAQAGRQRLEGFKRALYSSGIRLNDDYIVKGDWSEDSGRKAIEKLLKLKIRPTAVFVSGDEMAIGAIEVIRRKGLVIPKDISIVGFDDIPQASSKEISLTSVHQPLERVGRFGIKILRDIVLGEEREPVKLLLAETKIIERDSCAKIQK